MAHWTTEMPTVPGRYFYRMGEPSYDYGICLITWHPGYVMGDHVRQPRLRVMACSLFGYDHPEGWRNRVLGENSDNPGWSYSGQERATWNAEFWSEPLQAPPDFPVVNPERPPDVAPEKIEAEAEAHRARAARAKKADKRQAKVRAKAVARAIAAKTSLYECNNCQRLLSRDDLVPLKQRECPHCCTTFFPEEEGERNCPDCNRPFTSIAESWNEACPDCRDAEPDLTLLVNAGALFMEAARGRWIEWAGQLHRFDAASDAGGCLRSVCGKESINLHREPRLPRSHSYPVDGKGGPDCTCSDCIDWS